MPASPNPFVRVPLPRSIPGRRSQWSFTFLVAIGGLAVLLLSSALTGATASAGFPIASSPSSLSPLSSVASSTPSPVIAVATQVVPAQVVAAAVASSSTGIASNAGSPALRPGGGETPGTPVFEWRSAGHMPAPVSNPCVFLREGKILIVGGNDERGPVTAFREFDPETRSWRKLPSMQLARFGHGVAMFRDRLYVFGGIAPHRGRQQPVNSVEIFDFAANRWETGKPMPSPRARFGIAVLRGRVYLAGGEGLDGKPLAELICYDPFKERWERKQGLPSARNRSALAAGADSLFLFGGEGFAGRTLRTVLRYLPVDDRWVDAPAMRIPRKNIALARLGPNLVVTGGWDACTAPNDVLAPPRRECRAIPAHPGTPLLGQSLAASVHFPHRAGRDAKDGERRFIGETEIFDPRTQHWKAGGSLVTPRDGARMVAAAGRLWLFGGFDGAVLNSIESGGWQVSTTDWRIDEDLGLQVAFFVEPDPATTLPTRLHGPQPRSLGLSAEAAPDITNIRLDAFRGMGFPVPDRPDADQYSFYLKFFRYPPGLDHELTVRRVFDPLLVREAGNGETMKTMLASGRNLVVKKGFIGLAGRAFGPTAPFPPLVVPARPGRPQTFFDTHIPFTTLYVRPMTLPPSPPADAALASWTAGAVATCVRDLTNLYRLSFIELDEAANLSSIEAPVRGSASPSVNLYFIDDAETDSRLKSSANLRLIVLPRAPLCFSAFRGLPMPQDPKRLFLTGLALVREERYRVRSNPLAGTLRDAAFLRETIGSPSVRVFEIGSTVKTPLIR